VRVILYVYVLLIQADPTDSHSWLALALVESRRGCKSEARAIFEKGTHNCPDSVHLWQVRILLVPLMGVLLNVHLCAHFYCFMHKPIFPHSLTSFPVNPRHKQGLGAPRGQEWRTRFCTSQVRERPRAGPRQLVRVPCVGAARGEPRRCEASTSLVPTGPRLWASAAGDCGLGGVGTRGGRFRSCSRALPHRHRRRHVGFPVFLSSSGFRSTTWHPSKQRRDDEERQKRRRRGPPSSRSRRGISDAASQLGGDVHHPKEKLAREAESGGERTRRSCETGRRSRSRKQQ